MTELPDAKVQENMLTNAELLALIDSARAHPIDGDPGRALVLPHVWRVAHLLEEMMTAHTVGLSELVALAFRPAVETGIYGLYYLTHPEESERFLVGGDKELGKIFKNHDLVVPKYGAGDKAPVTWDQAFVAARKVQGRAEVPGYLDDLKMYYSAFSAQHLHGGLGAVGRYATVDGDNPAPNHRPVSILTASISIDFVGLILSDLCDRYEQHD